MKTTTAAPDLKTCIALCRRTRLALQTAARRMNLDTDIDPAHMRLMQDCAEICETTADFMARNSPYHPYICEVCAAICEACAESCALLDGMEACAENCRECTTACRQLAD